MKKVYVDSMGYCEEARLDTQRLINLVKLSSQQNNFVYTNDICQADVIIYNACGHLRSKQDESIRDIKNLLGLKKKSAKLIVWGCLPKINPASLKGVYNGTLIGPEESWDFFHDYFNVPKTGEFDIDANTLNKCNIPKQRVNGQLSQREKITNLYARFEFHRDRLINFAKKRTREKMWYIKIVSGCKHSCTYCSDKLAYKSVRSQPIEKIIKQFQLGLNKGYRKFFFVGRDLGSYGYDIGTTLTDLLNAIIKRYNQIDYKIFLVNVSPSSLIELYPELEQALASKKITYLGSHIQSGSNKILKLMGKNFSLAKWVEIINDISEKYPKINLETSMMVGFPSETDEDFENSLNLLNDVLFDRIVVYKYNERPNLPSLKIKGRIPEIIKSKRYYQMLYHAALCRTKKQVGRFPFLTPTTLSLFLDMVIVRMRALVRSHFS